MVENNGIIKSIIFLEIVEKREEAER